MRTKEEVMKQEARRKLTVIERSNGRIFSCIFIKRDKTIRKMVARLGVEKGKTGKGMSWNPLERGMIPVYDMQKKGWRMINLNSLIRARVNGVTYNWVYPVRNGSDERRG